MSKEPGIAAKTSAVIWETDISTLPRWKAVFLRASRIAFVVGRDLVQGNLTLHAMSLVYTTLLSIVPLLAIGFSVLKGFGVHNEIEPMLAQFLAPLGERGAEITEKVIGFVDNTQVGVLGFIGLALLIYTVISLIQKIENAFNDTWHISQARSFARRFSDYLSVILVGPVLVFSAMGIQASLVRHTLVTDLSTIEPVGWAMEIAGRLMPNVLVVTAFTFIFIFVPNTKVRLGPAFAGGLISGLLWVLAGWAFASFVVTSGRYTAIYSAFATVIFAMIWLYVSWLIVLVGGCIAFYVQNPAYLRPAGGPIRLSNRLREWTALQIAAQMAKTFYAGEKPWPLDTFAKRLRLPREAVERVMLALEDNGLVIRTAEEPPGFMPARPPDETPVLAVWNAVRAAGEDSRFSLERVSAAPPVRRLMERSDGAVSEAFHGRTLKELALGEPDLVSSPDRRRAPAALSETASARVGEGS